MSQQRLSRSRTLIYQVGLVVVALAAWQFAPQIPGITGRWAFVDPFFISSPSRVVGELIDILTGRNDTTVVWSFIWTTILSAVLGTAIGVVSGTLCGIVLSNDERMNQVLRPFLIAFNATPRVALIPIVVIILGPSMSSSVTTAVLVVFFVIFFNAFEGGRTVPTQAVQNARVLGATKWQVMRRIRFRYVTAWTFAALPNAVSFGLVTVVTAEILTGYAGLGRLLVVAINSASSDLTFAVVFILSVVGIVLVSLSEAVRRRVLHWWDAESGRA